MSQHQMPAVNETDIAIIGMSCRFPGADTIEAFWQNLRDGVESITFFSDEELLAAGITPEILEKPNYVKAKGILSDVEGFDAAFFGYSPREAMQMDPQHRLFLEEAWKAIEHAGYDPERYDELIGVYAGIGMNTYLLNNLSSHRKELEETIGFFPVLVGNDKDYVPTKVSYKLNLRGPSMTVQTACSTSLVTTHLACQALLNGECDMALSGGCSLQIPHTSGYLYQEGMILSPDGHCRAFDAEAKGIVYGNGVGIVVLKRLANAFADGDTIHAVIKGTALNNDGALKVAYTAPSVDGQAAVIAEAQAMAGVDSETISYIETHGTGTAIGDPIEIAALTQAFREQTDKNGFCAIGAVKSNVGHLDTAAGVAGLIKTVLAFTHRQIPPSLHFTRPNPKIDFARSPFYVNNRLADWDSAGMPRRAGVSSFGFGGTNAHIVMEEAPEQPPSGRSRERQVVVLSAKTATALDTASAKLADHLRAHPDLPLADVAHTLQVGRQVFQHRRVVLGRSLEEVAELLTTPRSKQVFTQLQEAQRRPVIFMFPGQGAQYVNMGKGLYEREQVFRNAVDDCAELFKPLLNLALREVLYPDDDHLEEAAQQLRQTAVTQPALFVIEFALARLWMAWGIQPRAVIGHSLGEYVAACLAGVFSLNDAISLLAVRARLMQELPAGAMLSVPLSEQDLLPQLPPELSIAALNAPSMSVVSGTIEAVDAFQEQLKAQGIATIRLHTSHGFHSAMMEPMLEEFSEQVRQVELHPPTRPWISTVTGNWVSGDEVTQPEYWARNLRQTVRFAEGISRVFDDPAQVLLEVGPGSTLSTLAKRHPDKPKTQTTLTSLRHPQARQSDDEFLLTTLGKLWLEGVTIDWAGFAVGEQRRRVPLPTYPFEHQRFWVETTTQAVQQNIQQAQLLQQVWQAMREAAQTYATEKITDVENPTEQTKRQLLERLCVGYLNAFLKKLGAFDTLDESYSFEEFVQTFHILPRYHQLLSDWLDVLQQHKQIRYDGSRLSHFLPISTDTFQALEQETAAQWNDEPENIAFLKRSADQLAEILTGKIDPLGILFPGDSFRVLDALAQESKRFHYYNAIMQASVQRLVNTLPPDAPLRILEIGGGSGITAGWLLPVLPKDRATYIFTDVSAFLLDNAKERFAAYPFVEYRLLDIDRPPEEQGYERHDFDIVVAANMLHVTPHIERTVQHVHTLLAPGGIFMIWEITRPLLDFAITYSLIMDEVEDDNRSQGNPFLSKQQWLERLEEHGFQKLASFPDTDALGYHVLLAQTAPTATRSGALAFTDAAARQQESAGTEAGRRSDIAEWFYAPSWQRSVLTSEPTSDTSLRHWMVFLDDCGVGNKLVERLKENGHDVTTVTAGTEFSHLHEGAYRVNPENPDDYISLFQEFAQKTSPTMIAHLWSVTNNVDTELSLERLDIAQKRGLHSLILLTQALGQQEAAEQFELAILSNNMHEVTGEETLCPEKATLLGITHVIPQEYQNIRCRSVDMVLPKTGTPSETLLTDQLLQELTSPSKHQIIAYRGRHRWIQAFESIRLASPAGTESPRLRHGGVYFIPGGLGGIGLVLAKHLAKTLQAKLILSGRTNFPARETWSQWLATHDADEQTRLNIETLQELEGLGAEILTVRADLSDQQAMQAAFDRAVKRFGRIDGVIHAAGVPAVGVIQRKKLDEVERNLAAKVRGSVILHGLLKKYAVDFVLFCSSVTSIQGGFGQVDYCAANAFLDAFAHYRSTEHGQLTISIDWDRWKDVGMAVAMQAQHKAMTGEELHGGMSAEEGIDAFTRIIEQRLPQVIVSPQNFLNATEQRSVVRPPERREAPERSDSSQAMLHPRPELSQSYAAATNEIEQTLVELWQKFLGVEQIGIHDDFFELGGDSLLGTQIISRIRETFHFDLPISSLFAEPTVAGIATLIQNEQQGASEVAQEEREEGEI